MDTRFKGLGFGELGGAFTALNHFQRTESDLSECVLLERTAFQRLQDISTGVDWDEFHISPQTSISGEGCTWVSFCDEVGKLGVVHWADPRVLQAKVDDLAGTGLMDDWKARADASGHVCRWLRMVEEEHQEVRLRRLLAEYSEISPWKIIWYARDELAGLLLELRYRTQGNRPQQKTTGNAQLDADFSSVNDSELKVLIADKSAWAKYLNHEFWTMGYLVTKLYPEKSHLLPVVDFSLPAPTNRELLNYAQQCMQLEESLRPRALPPTLRSDNNEFLDVPFDRLVAGADVFERDAGELHSEPTEIPATRTVLLRGSAAPVAALSDYLERYLHRLWKTVCDHTDADDLIIFDWHQDFLDVCGGLRFDTLADRVLREAATAGVHRDSIVEALTTLRDSVNECMAAPWDGIERTEREYLRAIAETQAFSAKWEPLIDNAPRNALPDFSQSFRYLARTINQLLRWAVVPGEEPIDHHSAWAAKDNIEDAADLAIRSIERHPDRTQLAEKATKATQQGFEFALLLSSHPTLTMTPVEEWTVPRYRRMFNDLDTLQHEFKALSAKKTQTGKEHEFAWQDSPDTSEPSFLGLTVDSINQTVERNCRRLQLKGVEWHTFRVAFETGEYGATPDRWMAGYPGDKEGKGPAMAKNRLKGKLQKLGITIENGSGVKLIEWDGNS